MYLQQAEGKKFAQVLCPHCGKANKVAADRIHQALRFSPAPAENEAAPAGAGSAGAGPAQEAEEPDGPAEEATPPA